MTKKRIQEPEQELHARVPKSWLEPIDRVAKARGITRQVWVRIVIWRALRRAGEKVNRSDSQRAMRRIHWTQKRTRERGGPPNRARSMRTRKLTERWLQLEVQFTREGEVWVDDSYFASGWLSRDGLWHHESPIPFEVLLYHLREQYLANVSLPDCWRDTIRKYDTWHDFSGRETLDLS